MKKLFVVISAMLLLASLVFANGNAEKLATLEGEVILKENAAGKMVLMLQTKDGKLLEVGIGEAELAKLQLQLQNKEQIKVKGVFIGATAENKIQEKLLVRTMTIDGKEVKVENPVQLTEQEKRQVRAYDTEQSAIQTKNQDMAGEASGSGNAADSGSGSGGNSAGSGSDNGSGGAPADSGTGGAANSGSGGGSETGAGGGAASDSGSGAGSSAGGKQ